MALNPPCCVIREGGSSWRSIRHVVYLGKADRVGAQSAMLCTERENQMSVKEFGLDVDGKLGLSHEDIVSVDAGFFGMDNMLRIGQLISGVRGWALSNNKASAWFSEEGCKCEILRTQGGGWQKGKIRFRLEFIPDEIAVPQQELKH